MDADTADFSFDDVVAQLEPPEDEPPAGAASSGEAAGPAVFGRGEESSLYGDGPESLGRRAEDLSGGDPSSDGGFSADGAAGPQSADAAAEDPADLGGSPSVAEDSPDLGGGSDAVPAEGASEVRESAADADVPDGGLDVFDFAAVASALEDGGDDVPQPESRSDSAGNPDEDSEPPEDFGSGPEGGEDSPGGPDSSGGKPALSEDELLVRKERILAVMEDESALLDEILGVQAALHSCVRGKDWDGMNARLEELQSLGDKFSSLEEERESLCAEVDVRRDADVSPVLVQVRGKLQRSRIENRVLNEYISTTRKFLQGVFDSVVPQRRNTLYSRTGRIIRPEPTAVAVDIEL